MAHGTTSESPSDVRSEAGAAVSIHAMNYSTGLTGVNIAHDNISSYTLWSTMAFIFLIIILVRLMHRWNAHLRHVVSMSSITPDQQNYWSKDQTSWWPSLKKHLIYAPLHRKRHNQEKQLSSAINVGTLPSRLHTLILVVYLVSNIAYCAWLNYAHSSQIELLAELRGRTGHLSVVNMVGLFLLAGRNNPLIPILRVSFDTFNLFHRWIGRIVILEAIVHTFAWGGNRYVAKGMHGISEALTSDPFCQYGLLGVVTFSIILFQSPSTVRHAFYEIFLHLHQFLAAAALLGIYMHAKIGPLPQMPHVIAIFALWSYDRIFRVLRILYRNVSFTRGLTKVTVEALPGEACRVTFELPRPWTHRPGTHAYAYLPSISLWMSHPFSIAWSEDRPTDILSLKSEKAPSSSTGDVSLAEQALPSRTRTSFSLIMSKRTGMTATLYRRAMAAPSRTLHLTGGLEGPYGGLESLHSYSTVVLFAGGAGITHQISHVRDLIEGFAAHTVATRKITLVWTVRTIEQLEWVRPYMDAILAMEGRKQILKIMLFVTKPRSAGEVSRVSDSVSIFPGRPKPDVLVQKEFQDRVGAMVVGVCGPGAFADDVRAAARGVVEEGKCDFWEESFTW